MTANYFSAEKQSSKQEVSLDPFKGHVNFSTGTEKAEQAKQKVCSTQSTKIHHAFYTVLLSDNRLEELKLLHRAEKVPSALRFLP